MSYKKLNLANIVSELGTKSWAHIKSKVNALSGYIELNINDEEFIALKRKYKKIRAGFSYRNFSNASVIKNRNTGDIFDVKLMRYDISRAQFMFNDKIIKLSTMIATFECPACCKFYNVEFNPSRVHRQTSICKRCQKSILHKCNDYRENYERSILKKYGVKRPIQHPQISKKMQETMVLKYGTNFSMQSEIVKKHHADSMIKKWGRNNFFANINPLKEFGWSLRSKDKPSKFELEIARFILDNVPSLTKVYSALTQRFFISDGIKCVVPDVYVPDINLIIEAYGDYWHANPNLYEESKIFYGGRTMKQINDSDDVNVSFIKEKTGADVIIIWESDWNTNRDNVTAILRERIK